MEWLRIIGFLHFSDENVNEMKNCFTISRMSLITFSVDVDGPGTSGAESSGSCNKQKVIKCYEVII